jgi:hypothetical protein
MGPEGPRGVSDHAVDRGDRPRRLRWLKLAQPALGGWILEDCGLIRRHGKGSVNGEGSRGETPVGADDRIEFLRSMT